MDRRQHKRGQRNELVKATTSINVLVYATVMALLLAACSNDLPQSTATYEQPGVILFGNQLKMNNIEWVNGRYATRQSGDEVLSETPQDIGVFAFGDGQNTTYVFRNQKVYWKDAETYGNKFEWNYDEYSNWPYTTDENEATSVQRLWGKMRYRFFAYSPWYETKHVNVSGENYATFNTFTWDNIPGFSLYDFVLANEIHDLDNTANKFTTSGNVVTFRMRHILSRIRFFFKISPYYRQLRKIELNSVTVLTAGKVKTATFNFTNDTWNEKVNWSNETSGNADPVTLVHKVLQDDKYVDDTHYEIPLDYPAHDDPYASVYVYPQSDFSEIKLRINYTVYDSENIITREAELTNIIELPNWTLLSGYYYDIKINIVPDYLYVLSDNDQEMDGYVVIKDSGS